MDKIGGNESYVDMVVRLYADEEMSGIEISEYIYGATGVHMHPRSIQRTVGEAGVVRKGGDAFRLACAKGRVKWKYKSDKFKRKRMAAGKRYEVLARDGFACVLCGATAKDGLLEVDHIIPICKGGGDEMENLRTLCNACNVGKRVVEGER